MRIRIALLYGCYLVSSGEGAVQVRCEDALYAGEDIVPVMSIGGAPGSMTAREFVRESMRVLVGNDETRWPALARTFADFAPHA